METKIIEKLYREWLPARIASKLFESEQYKIAANLDATLFATLDFGEELDALIKWLDSESEIEKIIAKVGKQGRNPGKRGFFCRRETSNLLKEKALAESRWRINNFIRILFGTISVLQIYGAVACNPRYFSDFGRIIWLMEPLAFYVAWFLLEYVLDYKQVMEGKKPSSLARLVMTFDILAYYAFIGVTSGLATMAAYVVNYLGRVYLRRATYPLYEKIIDGLHDKKLLLYVAMLLNGVIVLPNYVIDIGGNLKRGIRKRWNREDLYNMAYEALNGYLEIYGKETDPLLYASIEMLKECVNLKLLMNSVDSGGVGASAGYRRVLIIEDDWGDVSTSSSLRLYDFSDPKVKEAVQKYEKEYGVRTLKVLMGNDVYLPIVTVRNFYSEEATKYLLLKELAALAVSLVP